MTHTLTKALAAGIFAAVVAIGSASAQEAEAPQAPETPQPPENFTSFGFAENEQQAETLNSYLWYHFYHRMGQIKTLFNKEYLLYSDMWLNNAFDKALKQPIQEIHREHLLSIEIDDEGYVSTHQHFSHSQDWGWPFPLWPQADSAPERVLGKAAGWHFQAREDLQGWVGSYFLHQWPEEIAGQFYGQGAIDAWEAQDADSQGIVDNAWKITTTGPSAALTSPEDVTIMAKHSPYLQLRWNRSGESPYYAAPYVEWIRDQDEDFSPERRVYFYTEKTPLSPETLYHSILNMHRHPQWEGEIKRMRIVPAPGEEGVEVSIDSFFTVYDTRHTINNPIFIMASDVYFEWTRDLDFLRQNINRMRLALRYQQEFLGGRERSYIRNVWPGHDARPGWEVDEEGNKIILGGRGIGTNYWDLLPFGWDDFYATSQYYAATLAMADIEEAIRENPGWDIPRGIMAQDPQWLREHAAQVKERANEVFWNEETGRFYASINPEGTAYDYGFTFLNLDAIWYGIASQEHAESIMSWLTGERTIEGDTSVGEDIYHWRFGPRATTRRNVEWYGQGWHAPEDIPWGGQIQDGGAVLGFTFYDLWARLKVLGPDNAWQRLEEILAWEREVHEAGGYRAYYEELGVGLQGGGTAGGIGIDFEFFESSLLPSIVPYGFMGISPQPDGLHIEPALPQDCPTIRGRNLLYRGTRMDIEVSADEITVTLHEAPVGPIRLALPEGWQSEGDDATMPFMLTQAQTYAFTKASE